MKSTPSRVITEVVFGLWRTNFASHPSVESEEELLRAIVR